MPDSSTIVNQLSTGEIDATFFADPVKNRIVASDSESPDRRDASPFGYSLDFNLSDPVIGDA